MDQSHIELGEKYAYRECPQKIKTPLECVEVWVETLFAKKSIKMTVDVYGHLVPGANRDAANRLPSMPKESEVGDMEMQAQKNLP